MTNHHESAQLLTENGDMINKPDTVKNLGIFMEEDVNFKKHMEVTISKGRKQIGWIMRTFKCRDQFSMITLYKSIVLPIIEYCSQLWCPTKIGAIRKLEAIQRNFTHRIQGMHDLNYWQRLNQLKLYSLERRRERYTILYVYKIVLSITPNFEDQRFSIKTRFSERRGLLCEVPALNTTATARIKSVVDQSFAV